MSSNNLSRKQKRERNLQRKHKNAQDMIDAKLKVKRWLGLGGEYSTLELVVLASEKLGRQVHGKVHYNHQIKFIAKLIDNHDKPIKNVKTKKDFYSSRLWKILRYQAFEKYGNKCQCCGASTDDGVKLHVDHVKPRSTHPELELDINNLQVLCEDCNVGKLNQWDTDWKA